MKTSAFDLLRQAMAAMEDELATGTNSKGWLGNIALLTVKTGLVWWGEFIGNSWAGLGTQATKTTTPEARI